MSDPVRERRLVSETLNQAAEAAQRYLADIDHDRVRRPGADAAAASLNPGFPEVGDGAVAALDELIRASDGRSGPPDRAFSTGSSGATRPLRSRPIG